MRRVLGRMMEGPAGAEDEWTSVERKTVIKRFLYSLSNGQLNGKEAPLGTAENAWTSSRLETESREIPKTLHDFMFRVWKGNCLRGPSTGGQKAVVP